MPYEHVIQRSKRISLDIEKLIKRNEELEEACRKLRAALETEQLRFEANFRVVSKEKETAQ